MNLSEQEQKQIETSEKLIADVSLVAKFFRARLNIGYIAYPYVILGFLLHWSLRGFDFDLVASIDIWGRLILASIIAFTYMPYIFVINDYFDAPYDARDEKKRIRNPFCSKEVKNMKNLRLYLSLPGIATLVLGFLISWQAGIITILALLLGIYYSAKPFRFKEKPFLDFFVHGFSLGVFFFALGFYSFWIKAYEPFTDPLFLLLLIFSFTDAAWIHIDSAILDFTSDKKTNQNTTVVFLGPSRTILLLKTMLLTMLTVPAIFILLNNPLIAKYGIEVTLIIFILLLTLPLSYIAISWGGKNKYEYIRHISSRYRVYSVYFMSIFFILFANPNFFL